MDSSNISVVIIALNEADRIARCIDSVADISDDIIVVDSSSTDDTVSIAKAHGAKALSTDWKGYGATKNWGVSHAKNDWILSLDCDEYLSSELIVEIKNLQLAGPHIYKLNRLNHLNEKPIYHSGWHPDWVDRLYHKKYAKWNDSLVHERLEPIEKLPVIKLSSFLIHHSYRNRQDYLDRIEKYAKLKAQSWVENKQTPPLWKRWFGPGLKYLITYYIKRGILDGREGKEIAEMSRYLVKRQLHYFDEKKNA